MFKKIEKGLEVYKKAVHQYFGRLEEIKKKYGNEDAFRLWDEVDYSWAVSNSLVLRGMERVLGLSEKQVKQIAEEIKAYFKDQIRRIETKKIGEIDCKVCGSKLPIEKVLAGCGTLMVKVNNELRLIPKCPTCKEPRCSECGGRAEIEYAEDYPDTIYCFECGSHREIRV